MLKIAITLISAGLIAEVAFEAYAWLLSPRLFGETLEPAKLVMGLFKNYLSIDLNYAQAFMVHFIIGSVVFAAAVYVIGKLLKDRFVLSGVLTGLGLWFVAQGILAPLMGRAFMMDFGPYTQSSFVGHLGMTLIIGLIFTRACPSRNSDTKG